MSEYKIKPIDSGEEVKEFYNKYFTEKISIPSNKIDAVVGFFSKRGFDESSSANVATVLIQQSIIDNVEIFTLLDTLKGLDDVQISGLVAEILNYNRSKNSIIGFKVDTANRVELRNIVAWHA